MLLAREHLAEHLLRHARLEVGTAAAVLHLRRVGAIGLHVVCDDPPLELVEQAADRLLADVVDVGQAAGDDAADVGLLLDEHDPRSAAGRCHRRRDATGRRADDHDVGFRHRHHIEGNHLPEGQECREDERPAHHPQGSNHGCVSSSLIADARLGIRPDGGTPSINA